MPDYGQDISCTTDLDPTFRLVDGETMMAQVCVRRLYCGRGQLLSDPNDETIDAREFVSNGMKQGELTRVKALCESALLADPRVFSVRVKPSYDAGARRITLPIQGTGSEGPFQLTLAVSDVTVELLRD